METPAPSPRPRRRRLLLLGGGREARDLAQRLAVEGDWDVMVSLAGRTRNPAAYGTPTRSGGFGGAAGLAAYLSAGEFSALVDATHPFAAQISANAAAAAETTGVALLRLTRPPWRPEPGDAWIDAPTLQAAAATLPHGARVFLAVGPGAAESFAARSDLWCALRRAEATQAPFPLAQGRWIIGAPSDDSATERALLQRLDVRWLVTKNSGGARAKLDAARDLGLSVVMTARPPAPAAVRSASNVEDACALLGAL